MLKAFLPCDNHHILHHIRTKKIYTIICLSLYVLSCTDSSTFPLILKTLAVSPLFPFKLATLAGMSGTLVVSPSPSQDTLLSHAVFFTFPLMLTTLVVSNVFPFTQATLFGMSDTMVVPPSPLTGNPSQTDFFTFPLILTTLSVSPMSPFTLAILTGMSETLVVPSSPLTGNPPSTNF